MSPLHVSYIHAECLVTPPHLAPPPASVHSSVTRRGTQDLPHRECPEMAQWPPQRRHSPRAIFSFVWKMRVLAWVVSEVWLLRSSIWDWTGSPQEAVEEMMGLAAVDHPTKKFGARLGLASLVSSRQSRSYRGTSLKNERQIRYFTMAFIFKNHCCLQKCFWGGQI